MTTSDSRPALLPAAPFRRVHRPSLFRIEAREVISSTALELLLGAASYLVEGEWGGLSLRGESPGRQEAAAPHTRSRAPEAIDRRVPPQHPALATRDPVRSATRGKRGPNDGVTASTRRRTDRQTAARVRQVGSSAENAFLTVMLTLDLSLATDLFSDLIDRYTIERLVNALPHEIGVRRHLDTALGRVLSRQGAPWRDHRGWTLDVHVHARGTSLLIDGDAVVSMPAAILNARSP